MKNMVYSKAYQKQEKVEKRRKRRAAVWRE